MGRFRVLFDKIKHRPQSGYAITVGETPWHLVPLANGLNDSSKILCQTISRIAFSCKPAIVASHGSCAVPQYFFLEHFASFVYDFPMNDIIRHTLITAVEDVFRYERNIYNNRYLSPESLSRHMQRIRREEDSTAALLNGLLNQNSVTGWCIVCPDSLELLEDPLPALENADPDCLYCVAGRRVVTNYRRHGFSETVGQVRRSAGGKALPHFVGLPCASGTPVDTPLYGFLMVHVTLLTRFRLQFSLDIPAPYILEDFCLYAADRHGIVTRVLPLDCCLHLPDALETSGAAEGNGLALVQEKFKNGKLRAGAHGLYGQTTGQVTGKVVDIPAPEQPGTLGGGDVYSRPVKADDRNLPVVLAAERMKPGAKILDVGCACGDNGVYLRNTLGASLWGMEYDKQSLARTLHTGAYREALHVDLEHFFATDYSRFYGFFDHIFMGDVLEHLRDPKAALLQFMPFLAASGSFLISLPNVAHLHVIANLLQHRFQYAEAGILDTTHLRFFTKSSLAGFFAAAGLRVTHAQASFAAPDENRLTAIPKNLPPEVYDLLWKDRHFMVCQYVTELIPNRDTPQPELVHDNELALDAAASGNEAGYAQKAQAVAQSQAVVDLHARGLYSKTIRDKVSDQWASGNVMGAVEASLLFDPDWYARTYPDVPVRGVEALAHYMQTGWKEGKDPGPFFNSKQYFEENSDVARRAVCPLLHFLGYGLTEGRALPYRVVTADAFAGYGQRLFSEHGSKAGPDFVPETSTSPLVLEENDPKLIALYLPQFYPFKENDRWWGKGFTEWTNVTAALPQYVGHYQPHLPIDLGLYDLRSPEVAARQIELAKNHGIYGFCYYYYWFSGKKIMDMPISRVLSTPELDLPFCIAWANEPWSALWDGGSREILVDQSRIFDVERFFADIEPLLHDPRYIRVQGKPMLTVYRPDFFGQRYFAECAAKMQDLARQSGLPGLYLLFMKRNLQMQYKPAAYGGEAFIEFPPADRRWGLMPDKVVCNPNFVGKVCDMEKTIRFSLSLQESEELIFRGIMPMWDNTARKAETNCLIFENGTPALYEEWLGEIIARTRQHNPEWAQYIFINAWNEWGEGAHLEPDRKYGYAFLEATRQGLLKARCGR